MSKQYRVRESKNSVHANAFFPQYKGLFGWKDYWNNESWDMQENGPIEFPTKEEAWEYLENQNSPESVYHYE
jgi:hypothetical protein